LTCISKAIFLSSYASFFAINVLPKAPFAHCRIPWAPCSPAQLDRLSARVTVSVDELVGGLSIDCCDRSSQGNKPKELQHGKVKKVVCRAEVKGHRHGFRRALD